MKRKFFLTLPFAAMLLTGCTPDDDKAGTTGDMMRFTATIDNGGAKTVIDGVNMKWTDGDQININGTTFTAEVEGDGKTAVFTGETVDSPYTALYPATLYQSENSYKLPAEQTYNGENNLSGINPMYAESTTTELQFHNICGLLKLDVKGEGTVKEIVVSRYGKALCGPFTIENNRAVVSSTNDSVVTLKCGAGVAINGTTATTFYIALPEGNYDNLKVVLKNGNSVTWSTTISAALHAGKIRAKELTGVDVVKPKPADALSGKFTINADGDKVYFSKGNLYCTRSGSEGNWSYSFAFEDKQYDCRSINAGGDIVGKCYKDGNGDNDTPENTSGLFAWAMRNGVLQSPDYGAFYTVANISLGSNDDKMDWGPTMGDEWRTLSGAELKYLLDTRGGTDAARYAKAVVNGIDGLILVPDGWSDVTYELKNKNVQDARCVDNTIIVSDWDNVLEPAGCVFLPAAGIRNNGTYEKPILLTEQAFYWCSSAVGSGTANSCLFYYDIPTNPGSVMVINDKRRAGLSVRLVCDE